MVIEESYVLILWWLHDAARVIKLDRSTYTYTQRGECILLTGEM